MLPPFLSEIKSNVLFPFILLTPGERFAKSLLWHFPKRSDSHLPSFSVGLFSILLAREFYHFFVLKFWQFCWNKSLWAGVLIFLAPILPISLDEWNPRLLKLCWKEGGAKSCIRWLGPPLHHVLLDYLQNYKSYRPWITLCTITIKFCWKESGAKNCIRWLGPPLHHVSLNFLSTLNYFVHNHSNA